MPTKKDPTEKSKQTSPIFYVNNDDIKKIKEEQKKRIDYLNYIQKIYYPC